MFGEDVFNAAVEKSANRKALRLWQVQLPLGMGISRTILNAYHKCCCLETNSL
jgi:hypothetical protein